MTLVFIRLFQLRLDIVNNYSFLLLILTVFKGHMIVTAKKRKHNGGRKFACPHCNHKANQKPNLKRHIRNVHEKRRK